SWVVHRTVMPADPSAFSSVRSIGLCSGRGHRTAERRSPCLVERCDLPWHARQNLALHRAQHVAALFLGATRILVPFARGERVQLGLTRTAERAQWTEDAS